MGAETYTDFKEFVPTWQNRADKCIAQRALTNSKRPECYIEGIYPSHVEHGKGVILRDTNGKSYVDFICGLGTNLLGYGNDSIATEVYSAYSRGPSHSLPSTYEVRLAEKLKEVLPFVDLFKFFKTGSDSCTAALRIARSYNNRTLVLTQGYHGWHDQFIAQTPPAHGVVPSLKLSINSLDRHYEDIEQGRVSAVIIEPIDLEDSDENRQWLNELRDLCTRTDTVLIFDEIITGLRTPNLSVAQYYGITPDLVCMGKALGNGMPIVALGGKREIMECAEYFVSGTFFGEACSLAAAYKTIHMLQTRFDTKYLWDVGNVFREKFNALSTSIQIRGYGTRGVFDGKAEDKALFFQEACKAGLLFGPSWFFAFPHTDIVDDVINVCADVFRRIDAGMTKLEGPLPRSPFSKKARNQ